eukprot:9336728-Prorocentrum_lima.AAC.1
MSWQSRAQAACRQPSPGNGSVPNFTTNGSRPNGAQTSAQTAEREKGQMGDERTGYTKGSISQETAAND